MAGYDETGVTRSSAYRSEFRCCDWYTASMLSRLFGVSPKVALKMMRKDDVAASMISGRLRISHQELRRWVASINGGRHLLWLLDWAERIERLRREHPERYGPRRNALPTLSAEAPDNP
jgi:hypothetical protein